MSTSTSNLSASVPLYGKLKQRFTAATNAPFQVATLVSELPLYAPSAAFEFSVAPVIDCRVGSRLSSRAAILLWSNTRSCFGFGGGGGVGLAASCFGVGFGFLASSDFKAS